MDTFQTLPGFRPVDLTDKPLFDEYLAHTFLSRSRIVYTFTNFYMWRHWDFFQWTEREHSLCLVARYPVGTFLLPPIAPDRDSFFRAMESMMGLFGEQNIPVGVSEVAEAELPLFQELWPGRFQVREYAAAANYVYAQQDLATLAGKKYDAKRNHVHFFQRNNPNWQVTNLTPELARECRGLFREWNDLLHPDDWELAQEAVGVDRALEHLTELKLVGAALLVGERPVAFTFGEPLNADTFCVHVEKADSRIRGAYQLINQVFSRDYAKGYRYINRAEDMGDPGQRRAKESYHPCRMEKDFLLTEVI